MMAGSFSDCLPLIPGELDVEPRVAVNGHLSPNVAAWQTSAARVFVTCLVTEIGKVLSQTPLKV